MDTLFLKIFNMSIAASWLILAVLLLRILFYKAPKGWRCVLWAMVGIRLIVPLSLESNFSLIPSREVLTPEGVYSMESALNTGIETIDRVLNPVVFHVVETATVELNSNPLQRWTFRVGHIWRLGVAVLLVYTLISYLGLKRKLSDAVLHKENIFQSEKVVSPFVLGIIRPRIYIPYGLSRTEMQCVLAHERAHIARKDHILKLVAFSILTIHWFNLFVWVAYILLCKDVEYACDEKVIGGMEVKEKREYSETLLSCSMPRRRLSMCPLAFGENDVKSRIRNVVNYRKPGFWFVVVSGALIGMVILCFLTNPVEEVNQGSIQDSALHYVAEVGEGIPEPEEPVEVSSQEPIPDEKFVLPKQAYEEESSMPELYVYNVAEPMEMVALQSGTASKTTMKNGQQMGIEMCGMGPLDEQAEHMEIELPGMCEVKLATVVPMDSYTVREYDSADRGDYDAAPLSVIERKSDEAVILEQGRIYEFHVVWEEAHLKEDGFYGDAYYFLETSYSSELYAIPPEISEILGDFTYVAKVEVVNGNTGERQEYDCCDGIDTMAEGIINLCKSMCFTVDEAVETPSAFEEIPVGYQYMIKFLDDDGNSVQKIVPYEDSVCIGGIRYYCETSYERGTSIELIKTLKGLF